MENGINSEIEFYVLDLDLKDKMKNEHVDISIFGRYYKINFLAFKKDNEENGIMIDLLTGTEIYPITKPFEPMLRYRSKRLATLEELENTSLLCSRAKNGDLLPLTNYTNRINKCVEFSKNYYDAYVKSMEGILTFMFETKPELDEKRSL